jgi:uncharacterized phage protein (predicted DNA packaging)
MLDTVKEYLRIDFDDDDNILTLFIDNAKKYIEDYTGRVFDENYTYHSLILLALVKSMYDNRGYTVEKAANHDYIIKTLLLREKLKEE